jgi:hypothetical protein
MDAVSERSGRIRHGQIIVGGRGLIIETAAGIHPRSGRMIAEIDHALRGFVWFLSLAVTGANFIPTGIILVALVVAGLLSYRGGDYAERGHISILLVLPLPWILIGVWDACFTAAGRAIPIGSIYPLALA